MKQLSILNWIENNRRIVLLIFFLMMISGSIFSQKLWTLRDCVEHALENNIQIKKSELNNKVNKANLLQSKLDFLPTLNASSGYSLGFGRSAADFTYVTQTTKNLSFSVNTGVMLFNGFAKFNSMKQAQLDYLASKYDSDKMRDDISLRIAQSYLNVLFSMELVEKNKTQLEVTNQQINNTKKLVKVGTLPKGSLLEIQSQLAAEEVNLISSKNRLNLAYLDLKQLLEIEASQEFEIEKPSLNVDEESKIYASSDVYNVAVGRLPEIKSAELRLKSAEKGLSIAKGLRSPKLSASFGWSTYYLVPKYAYDPATQTVGDQISFSDQFSDNISKSLGFSLSIPIFNGFQTSTNIKKSRLSVINSKFDLQLAKNNVRKNIEQAYSDALAAFKTYNASIKSVTSFKESFKYMERKFSVGMENSLNYNTSKAQLSKAESDLLAAKYDYIFKTKILEFYMGIPLSLKEN